MAYSKVGPFVNSGPPALNAAFFNGVENFLATLGGRDEVNGVAALDESGNLLVKTDTLKIPVSGSNYITFTERTSGEPFLQVQKIGTNDYAAQIKAGGIWKSLATGGDLSNYALLSHNHDASNINAGTLPAARLSSSESYYTIDPLLPNQSSSHRTSLDSHTLGGHAIFPEQLAFDGIAHKIPTTIEYTYNGTDWNTQDAAYKTSVQNVFAGMYQSTGYITIKNNGTGGDPAGKWLAYRITWDAVDWSNYYYLKFLYVYTSTNGHTMDVLIEKSYDATSWTTVGTYTGINTWPGHTFIPHSYIPWKYNPTLGTHYRYVRVTFTPNWNASYPNNNITIYHMKWNCTYPAGFTGDKPFTYDFSRITTFASSVNINASGSQLGFGSALRQMINLYSTTYGIGVQNNTTYVRSNGGRFSVYHGGSHSDTENDPGSGGSVVFSVNETAPYYKGNTMWHSANDGSGSGLDADLLDGQHASAFLLTTAQAADSLKWNGKMFPDNAAGVLTNDGDGGLSWQLGGTATNTDTVDNHHANEFMYLVGGTMTGPIYFIDPAQYLKYTGSPDYYMEVGQYDGKFRVYEGRNTRVVLDVNPSGFSWMGNTVWHSGNFTPANKLDATAQAADSLLWNGLSAPANASGLLKNDGSGGLSWAAGANITNITGAAQDGFTSAENFGYRQRIKINSSPDGALTNYQKMFIVKIGTGLSAGDVIFIPAGHLQDTTNWTDLKFRSADGATQLDHDFESRSASEAIVWVKLPSLPASGGLLIQMQYGAAGVADSRTESTWNFIDQFNGSAIDTNKWTVTDGTGFSVGSGVLTGTSTTGRLTSIAAPGAGTIIEAKVKANSYPTNGYTPLAVYNGSYAASAGFLEAGTLYTNYFSVGYQNLNNYSLGAGTGVYNLFQITIPNTTTVKLKGYIYDVLFPLIEDGCNYATGDASAYKIVVGRRVDGNNTGQAYNAQWDWIRVRKYTPNVPQVGYYYPEETGTATAGGIPDMVQNTNDGTIYTKSAAGWMQTGLPLFPTVVPNIVYGAGVPTGGDWPAGLNYRQKHTIIGSTDGAFTNYQVSVTLSPWGGTSTGDTMYLQGHQLDPNYADLSVTDAYGNPLSFWLEQMRNSTRLWVKFPYIPASPGTVDYYICYGGKNLSGNVSDGVNTWDWFDDFLTITNWTGAASGGDGGMRQYNGTELAVCCRFVNGWWYTATSKTNLAFSNSIIGFKYRTSLMNAGANNEHCYVKFGMGNFDAANSWSMGWVQYLYSGVYEDWRIVTSGTSRQNENGGYCGYPSYNSTYWPLNAGPWIYAQVKASNTNIWFFRETTQKWTGGWTSGLSNTFKIGIYGDTNQPQQYGLLSFDWIYQGKYTQNPPTHGAWGAEEARPALQAGLNKIGDMFIATDTAKVYMVVPGGMKRLA
jgi:hypothetical protein